MQQVIYSRQAVLDGKFVLENPLDVLGPQRADPIFR